MNVLMNSGTNLGERAVLLDGVVAIEDRIPGRIDDGIGGEAGDEGRLGLVDLRGLIALGDDSGGVRHERRWGWETNKRE